MRPAKAPVNKVQIVKLWNSANEPVDILHPGVIGTIEVDGPLYPFDLIRKKGKENILKDFKRFSKEHFYGNDLLTNQE